MLEYKQIIRMTDMNGNTDAIRKIRFEESGAKWMNTRVVGSHYIPKLTARVRKAGKNKMSIPHKSDEPYQGPSITNPNLALIMEDQKNTLGAYVGQVGNITVTRRGDLKLHPLHDRIRIPRETIQMLTKSATIVFKKKITITHRPGWWTD